MFAKYFFFSVVIFAIKASAQDCVDQDAAVAGAAGGFGISDCAGLVGALQCETDLTSFGFAGETTSTICPATCDACPDVTGVGLLLAYHDDGSCGVSGSDDLNMGDWCSWAPYECQPTVSVDTSICPTGVAALSNVNTDVIVDGCTYYLYAEYQCDGEFVVTIGSSDGNEKTVSVTYDDVVCPSTVDVTNWVNPVDYSDTFSVSTVDGIITVTRTDSDGGWGMNLQITCTGVFVPVPCDDQADILVAEAFCDSTAGFNTVSVIDGTEGPSYDGGTPQAAINTLCIAETSQTEAIAEVCAVEGVEQTVFVLCGNLGYWDSICEQVTALAAPMFPSCDVLAAGATQLCSAAELYDLVAEDTCLHWATADGPSIAMASESIMALAPDYQNALETCELVCQEGDDCGQVATEATCNDIPGSDLMNVCVALGNDAPAAIGQLCLELGFGDLCDTLNNLLASDAGADAMAMLGTCDDLVANQGVLCQVAASTYWTGNTCEEWAQDATSIEDFNIALSDIEQAEFDEISGSCGSVSWNSACNAHPLGHICSGIDYGHDSGLLFQAYNRAGLEHPLLMDTLASVQADVWNDWTPNVEHGMLGHVISYGSDIAFAVEIPGFTAENNFYMRWRGEFNVDTAGSYDFQTTSDDGSILVIDNILVVNNDGNHGMESVQGSIDLSAGAHTITIAFYEDGGGAGLHVEWKLSSEDVFAPISTVGMSPPGTTLEWCDNCIFEALSCEDQNDVLVAEAFCDSTPGFGPTMYLTAGGVEGPSYDGGTPHAAINALCIAETSNADAIATICAAEGVQGTVELLCGNLGYWDSICEQVGAIGAALFDSCDVLSAGASQLCSAGELYDLVAEDTCNEWAVADGPSIGLASESILAMAPGHSEAVAECEALCQEGDDCGRVAVEAYCYSVDPDSLVSACVAAGNDVDAALITLNQVCLQLGFSQEDCVTMSEALASDADMMNMLTDCNAMTGIQDVICPLAASIYYDDRSCVEFAAGLSSADDLNAALASIEQAELDLITSVCGQVAMTPVCEEDSSLGHICASIQEILDCQDSADFVDAWGSDCTGWDGYSCEWECDECGWGYTEQELLDIQDNCPSACGICSNGESEPEVEITGTVSVADDVEFVALEPFTVTFSGAVDENDWIGLWLADHHPQTHSSANWDYHASVEGSGTVEISAPAGGYYYVVMLCCDGTTEISERVYLTIADAVVNEDCPVDNADFVDSMNSDCSGWHGYDCTWDEETHTDWGYTEQDLLDVQENCPLTCGDCAGTNAITANNGGGSGSAATVIIILVVVGALAAGAAAYYFLVVAAAGKTEEIEVDEV